jgi:1,4-dihydroxy-2-naphthoate octaprenyltransferase
LKKIFMPQSRKRTGHHEHHQPSAVPARQRTKGRIIWAILFAVFGVIIAFFAASDNYIVLGIGAIIGAIVGYLTGKNMEQDAVKE